MEKEQANKNILVIYLKEVLGPSFVLWKWKKDDYDKYLDLQIDNARIRFKFNLSSINDKDTKLPDRQFTVDSNIYITIENPTQEMINDLNDESSKESKIRVANNIYSIYRKIIETLTLYGKWHLKLPSILNPMFTNFGELFNENSFLLSRGRVFWKINNNKFKQLTLKRKSNNKINPIFSSRNLLSVSKWIKLQKKISEKPKELSQNISELIRIKSKIEWGEKKIPTIEIAAIIEVIIRSTVVNNLKKHEINDKKIKDFRDDINLSTLLNILLPFILKKNEMKKYKKYLDNLDSLRKIRNKIMHENIQEKEIDLNAVKRGVNAAIKITTLLEKKSGQ